MASWDERYRRGEFSDQTPSDLLAAAVELSAAGRALDLACGAGRHSLFLAERGWRVVAVEKSAVAVGILKERARGIAVMPVIADLEQFVIPPASFDLIVDFHYLDRKLFPSIRAGLRPGGLAVVEIRIAGIHPNYTIASGELPTFFPRFEILRYEETARAARLIARAP